MKQKILRKTKSSAQQLAASFFSVILIMCVAVSALAQPMAPRSESFAHMALNVKSEYGRTKSIVTIRAMQSVSDQDESNESFDGFQAKLENFNGIYANGFTKLGWNTLMEYNLGDFIVERSRDGVEYNAIGKVAAFGNTNNFSSYYTFMDISSERGANFYRLKLMDKDSSFSYSRVIVINTEAKEISLLLVYPNPFGKKVQAKIECDKPEKLTIRVINHSGQVIRTQYNDLHPGENIVTVNNVADLPSGPYVLEMVASTRTMRTQIMKQ